MKNLTNMSDAELAKWQVDYRDHSINFVLAEKEWERRARLEQHELDLKLLSKQVQWMKYSVIAVVISALGGAVVGAILQGWLHK